MFQMLTCVYLNSYILFYFNFINEFLEDFQPTKSITFGKYNKMILCESEVILPVLHEGE